MMNTFEMTFETQPTTCPACGSNFSRQYEVIGLLIADYACGLTLGKLNKSWVVRTACPQAMGRVIRLMAALDKKVKTWARVCDCHNEFGEDAAKSCGEFMEQDDAAMLELETVYEDVRRGRAAVANPAAVPSANSSLSDSAETNLKPARHSSEP